MSLDQSVPLCIDLDGTLLKTDSLDEGILNLFKKSPRSLLSLLSWSKKGRSYFKWHIALNARFDFEHWPYNSKVIDFAQQQKNLGRKIYLVTASPQFVADGVAHALKLFDGSFGSSETLNLKAEEKANRLVQEFGDKKFDYIGNSDADLPVWKVARKALVVGDQKILAAAKEINSHVEYLSQISLDLSSFLKAIRPHQWLKNILIFIPLIAAHRFYEMELFRSSFLGFLSFSMGASAVYVFNDLFDLEADRRHQDKRRRPFASGSLTIKQGLFTFVLLLLASLSIGKLLAPDFRFLIALYLCLSTVYSIFLKRLILWDIVVLACLYTLRILAGGAATTIPISEWLMAFSMFFFFNLACLKRFSELETIRHHEERRSRGRGYRVEDLQTMHILGIGSGLLSVLVFALYLHSDNVRLLYLWPLRLWLICPVLIYWIGQMWIMAGRGQIHSDTVVFAAKEKSSYVALALIAVIIIMATY